MTQPTDFIEQLAALAEKATPDDILECEGAYPGLVELLGLSFKVSFWTMATDIAFEQAQQRRADADLLRALWNHRDAILALGRERDELRKALYQYRSDLLYPPASDSRERRIAMIDALLAGENNRG